MSKFFNSGAIKVKVVTLAAAVAIAGGAVLAPIATVAAQMTVEQLMVEIAKLQAQLSALQGESESSGVTTECDFTRNLRVGIRGDDVTCLQEALTETGNYTYAGGATGYFGAVTKKAVMDWQTENDLPSTGYFGPMSRERWDEVMVGGGGTTTGGTTTGGTTTDGTTTTTTTTTTTSTAVGALTVSSPADQPAANLAPGSAARIPFTKAIFTASAAGDVTVKSITVERQGLAADGAFTGVLLLDETGTQLGIAKTLNSVHQVALTESFVVKAGQSRTMTIGANMETLTNLATYAGQVAKLSVVGVDAGTSAVSGVSATSPIAGNGMTINATLTIGDVTMLRGAVDPGSSVTKPVGTTGYTFAGIKVTAGSAEKVYLKYVRWNQTGSISSGDLTNLKTYVDGTAYNIVVSSDGKYYTSTFEGDGLLIDKGFSKEISIKGDVSGGSGRTIQFDIAKRTDLAVKGQLFGYGIIPPQTNSCGATTGTACFTSSEDPWYDSATFTVSNGTINVSASASVPSQNIAINVNNQPIGAFSVDIKGEDISVGRLAFNITLSSEGANDDVDDITNVTLVDENGSVVAGPVDGSATDSSYTSSSGDGSVVFSSTVTFPIGVHIYKLLGKIGTDIDNNVSVIASTTPSNDFSTVKGVTTGNSITPAPASAITMSTMTVKSGALTATVSSVPIAQSVVANTKGFVYANYIMDATGSGEDIRVTTLPLAYDAVSGGSATDVTNCQLYDGSTSVTSGSNVVNPSAVSSSTTFTFDGNGLLLTKGTSKTLALKCDLSSGATGVYRWGLDGGTTPQASYTGATGVTSGQTVGETLNDSIGQNMTASTGGTLTVILDSNSPSYRIVAAGTTNVELARVKFSASNENIDVKRVALVLTQAASNTPIDLVGRQVTLWDGVKQIGTATFPTGDTATSSSIVSGDFTVLRDGLKVLTVKGDIASIGVSGPLTASGDLLAVDWDPNNLGINGTYGTGLSSGNTITPTSGYTSNSAGVRIMKAYPTLAKFSLPTNTLSAGGAADVRFYRFSVKANNGDVAVYKLTFDIGSSTLAGTTSAYSLYAYDDSGFATTNSFAANGLVNAGSCYNGQNSAGQQRIVELYPDKTGCNRSTTTFTVPSGVTRYFELRGTTAGISAVSTSKDTITVQLSGDAAYPADAVATYLMNRPGTGTNEVDADTNDDFIWSPISTTTQNTINDLDYTNGYQLEGLPSTGMSQETLQN